MRKIILDLDCPWLSSPPCLLFSLVQKINFNLLFGPFSISHFVIQNNFCDRRVSVIRYTPSDTQRSRSGLDYMNSRRFWRLWKPVKKQMFSQVLYTVISMVLQTSNKNEKSRKKYLKIILHFALRHILYVFDLKKCSVSNLIYAKCWISKLPEIFLYVHLCV